MNKLNKFHEKCLLFITKHYDSDFKELLELSDELSIHKTCISYLMIEVYKNIHGLSPELMTVVFTSQKNPYNIHSIRLLGSENPRSVRFGVYAKVRNEKVTTHEKVTS